MNIRIEYVKQALLTSHIFLYVTVPKKKPTKAIRSIKHKFSGYKTDKL